MAGRIILETDRLLLREFDEGDAAALYPLGSDPEVTRYTGEDPLTGVEHALEILRQNPIADYGKYGFGRWACVDRQSEEVIGFAGLKYLDDRGEVDIGYRLLPDFWGRGLATEACLAILDYGFGTLGLERIIGLVIPENTASVRVLEKLGMRYVEMVDSEGTTAARYVLDAKDAR